MPLLLDDRVVRSLVPLSYEPRVDLVSEGIVSVIYEESPLLSFASVYRVSRRTRGWVKV